MKKKSFLLEMVWEGEKTHRKLISRIIFFCLSLVNFFFGVWFDQKLKKKFFAGNGLGGQENSSKVDSADKNIMGPRGRRPKMRGQRPKMRGRRPICEAEGLPPAFRRN